MFARELNCGAVLINIIGIDAGMWKKLNNTDSNFKENDKWYLNKCVNFVVEEAIPKILKSTHSTNIIKNLDKTYFLIRPYSDYTNKYVMMTGYNCNAYDKRRAKIKDFYLMGLIVLNQAKITSGNMYIIDWIKSFYEKAGSARTMVHILEDYYKIKLFPAHISLRPVYWSNYLLKYCDICCRNDLIDFIWKYSNKDLNNYYNIAYELNGYELLYSFDPIRQNEMNTELFYCYILYDY